MKQNILLISKLLILIFLLSSCQSNQINNSSHNNLIYGITLDSIEDINQSVDAIKSLSKRVITRLVFDEVPAQYYTTAIEQLSPYSDIMGELFDSEYIKDYTITEYKQRVNEYLDMYGDSIKIWEIGNEVNGEWTGDSSLVAQKTIYAYKEAKKRGYKTALTLYYNDYNYNDGCWNQPDEQMRNWAKDRLTDEIKNGIDYLFISYYEEDCDNYRPTKAQLEKVFSDLGIIFPHAKLGFGEIGTSKVNQKAKYIQRYYTLDIKHPRYIGGYFWWYFQEDMTPKSKPLWNILNENLK